MAHISVVIPVYRAEGCLHELYRRLKNSLETITHDFEIVMVEDCGGDNSWQIIAQLAQTDARVKGYQFSRNFGQHPAIAAGFDAARGDRIVLMDADLQDRPEELPRLLAGLNNEVDIVYTIKPNAEGGGTEQITSRIFHAVFSHVTRSRVPYGIGTYRAFTRKVLDGLLTYPEYNVLFGPLMFYVGYRSIFLEVARDERKHGPSSYSFWKRLSLALRSLASYTDLPNRIFFAAVLTVLALTLLYSATVIIQCVVLGAGLPSGLTLLALLILFSLAVMLIGLGIIGSYIFRVYQEVLRRPRYLVTQTLNLAPEPPRTA